MYSCVYQRIYVWKCVKIFGEWFIMIHEIHTHSSISILLFDYHHIGQPSVKFDFFDNFSLEESFHLILSDRVSLEILPYFLMDWPETRINIKIMCYYFFRYTCHIFIFPEEYIFRSLVRFCLRSCPRFTPSCSLRLGSLGSRKFSFMSHILASNTSRAFFFNCYDFLGVVEFFIEVV